MKKFIIMLLVLCSSYAFADNYTCPQVITCKDQKCDEAGYPFINFSKCNVPADIPDGDYYFTKAVYHFLANGYCAYSHTHSYTIIDFIYNAPYDTTKVRDRFAYEKSKWKYHPTTLYDCISSDPENCMFTNDPT